MPFWIIAKYSPLHERGVLISFSIRGKCQLLERAENSGAWVKRSAPLWHERIAKCPALTRALELFFFCSLEHRTMVQSISRQMLAVHKGILGATCIKSRDVVRSFQCFFYSRQKSSTKINMSKEFCVDLCRYQTV